MYSTISKSLVFIVSVLMTSSSLAGTMLITTVGDVLFRKTSHGQCGVAPCSTWVAVTLDNSADISTSCHYSAESWAKPEY